MILQPFTVTSGGKLYTMTAMNALDSAADRAFVSQSLNQMFDVTQQDAMCSALGIEDSRDFPTQISLVRENGSGNNIGVWVNAVQTYVSGPWSDTATWTETDPQATIILDCRPSPGFSGLSGLPALELAVDVVAYMLTGQLRTTEGRRLNYRELRWALFKNRTDFAATRALALHNRAAADPRFNMTESADPLDSSRTLAVLTGR